MYAPSAADMDRITFKINNVEHSVGCEVSSDVTLVDYLRNTLELRGTKYMCREAGCGACIVAVVKCPGAPVQAVNSCMISITSCHNWEITTIEGLGNRNKGYHILQKILANYNGSQCGYCSPAWVMAMHSLLQNRNDLTMLEIERSFGSNVCRCTGYRPILEAFKTLATDASQTDKVMDIEDLSVCRKSRNICFEQYCDKNDWCFVSSDISDEKVIIIKLKDNRLWCRPIYVSDIFKILKEQGVDSYMLIFGNTAKGAYPIIEYPRLLIDISAISELKGHKFDQNLIIGSSTTLTNLMDIFKIEAKREYFEYLEKLYEHLKLVAHIPVRNLGSLAGNLMIKHRHNEFPSDVFMLFKTVGAQLTIQFSTGETKVVNLSEFLKMNMKGQVIVNVLLPPLGKGYHLVTFKIMPRSQNAHAIVNAGFLYRLNNSKVIQSRIVYGGLSPFGRASMTEKCLLGKSLFNNETLQYAIHILKKELNVIENPPEFSAEYRRHLAVALFYKGLLSLSPKNILGSCYRNGGSKIHQTRPESVASQSYETNSKLWPLNQPLPKLEALIQCAGEAFYTDDMPTIPHEIHGAFALSTEPSGNIVSIDASEALKYPGVITFYTAKDIPGLNSFTPADAIFYKTNEEVLCSGVVKYYNQPIGIVVAETQHIANVAAKLIRVTYANVRKPVFDVREARKDPNRVSLFYSSNATEKGSDVAAIVKGVNVTNGQFHFTMENISCVTFPTEEGMKVYATTQWADGVQTMISRALKIDSNRIDVHVRRLGGAFGLKISRSIQAIVACSLITYKLNRPCRFVLTLPITMRSLGKRFPSCSDFEVGVSSSGVIQYFDYKLYEGDGYIINEQLIQLGVDFFNNSYNKARWNFQSFNTIIDVPKNSWFRAPASLEHISTTELIMEQISYQLSLDPIDLRLKNLDPAYDELRSMIETIKSKSDYTERRITVNEFNECNRWKKRGLRISLLRWSPAQLGPYDVNLSVYHTDGTVTITHSGIEMGQGINTKVVQVCAHLLNIPMDKIVIKANNTVTSPNSFQSAGSVTSQVVITGTRKCCTEILARLKHLRITMNQPTWEEIIVQAYNEDIDLQVHSFITKSDVVTATVFGVAVAEVEVDILTGEFELIRIDLLQDAGQSINPEIDIGQVEGAFIMGLGYWTCENLVYDKVTSELLTNRTWNYYVPQALDIPQDFRVYLRNNSYSKDAVYGAKEIAEIPICLSVVVTFAIREAVVSARHDSGIPTTQWFPSDGSYTVEKICLMSSTNTDHFKFN